MFDYLQLWIDEFGDISYCQDFCGRLVLRTHFARVDSPFGWLVERININGSDQLSNLHIVNIWTYLQRYQRDNFKIDGFEYNISKYSQNGYVYDYSLKDFCVNCKTDNTCYLRNGADFGINIKTLKSMENFEPDDFWYYEFGNQSEAVDFSGAIIRREMFGESELGGWNIDHILPLARSGQDNINNYQIASVKVNSLKADRLRFQIDGKTYFVKKSVDTSKIEWGSVPYRYLRKEYCVVKLL